MAEMIADIDVKEHVAVNVRRLLAARDWTQTQLSEITGDPISTISAICRGRSVAGGGVLARIAEAFDVSVDRLIAEPPPDKTA